MARRTAVQDVYTEAFKSTFARNIEGKARDLDEAMRCFHCHSDAEIRVIIHCKGCSSDLEGYEPAAFCICPIESAEPCFFCRGTGYMSWAETKAYPLGGPGPGSMIDKFSDKTRLQTVNEMATYHVQLGSGLDIHKIASILRRNKTAEQAAQSLRKNKCDVQSKAASRPMEDSFGPFEIFCVLIGNDPVFGFVRRYSKDRDVPKVLVVR